MSDDLDSIKAGLAEIAAELAKLSFVRESSGKVDDLKKEINNLLSSQALASPADWSSANQKIIIEKVKNELPARIAVVKGKMAENMVIETKEAMRVTIAGILLLLLLAVFYTVLHVSSAIPPNNQSKKDGFFLNIGIVKAAIIQSPKDFKNISAALINLRDNENGFLAAEFKDRVSFLEGIVEKEDTATVDQRAAVVKEEIEKIEKDAKALSRNDRFFWNVGYWKWLEIIFWGEFGVIIGILVWVAKQTETGKYTKEDFDKEKYWYATEVIIGPIVVSAVFFLLKQFFATVITGFALTEEEVRGSIYSTLGISFSLGLFIRRSLGVFDFIKDKLPLPKS